MSSTKPAWSSVVLQGSTNHLADQRPIEDDWGRSPLAHVKPSIGSTSFVDIPGFSLTELALRGHLILRCGAHDVQQHLNAAHILGGALPLTPLSCVDHGDSTLCWLGPDEWLITLPNDQTFAVESAFHAQMSGHWSLVNVSGGLTLFRLTGCRVVDVLKKSTVVDLHEQSFPINKVVTTVFAKTSVTLRRLDAECFDLFVRRSFADYIWLWLQDASREFGLPSEA